MTRWLRVVASPSLLLGMLLAGWTPYLFALAVSWALLGKLPDDEILKVTFFPHVMAAFFYGVYRVLRFHPVIRPPYRDWLARSPWSPGRPLPDGPVLLVPQDLVVAAVLGGPAYLVFGPTTWSLFPSFALGYLAALGFVLLATGPRIAAYLVLFGVVGLVGFAHEPVVVVGIAAETYLVAAGAFRLSLHSFPWEPREEAVARKRVWEARWLGWPFDRLAPLAALPVLRWWEGPVLGLLIGCGIYAVEFQFDRRIPAPADQRTPLVPFAVMLAAFARLVSYMFGHLPPISFWGRFATGRLVIPKYDVIFVAPLLAVVTITFGPGWLAEEGISASAAVAIAAGTAATILAVVGPDRGRWQLTAPARLIPVLKRPEKVRPPLPGAAVGR